MKSKGFTLIELVLVMAIIGILLGIVAINFSSWQKKAQVESQTRTLYASLNQARIDAMQHKLPRCVALQANGYGYAVQSYASETDARSAGVTVQNQASSCQITETFVTDPLDRITLFDVRGFTDNIGTFQINPTGTSALVDCIIVDFGRTNMGKFANGACTIK